MRNMHPAVISAITTHWFTIDSVMLIPPRMSMVNNILGPFISTPIGAELLIETIKGLEAGIIQRVKQDEAQSSYFPMLKKEMGEIDWRMSAHHIVCRVRGLTPWPGTSFVWGDNEGIKVWKAEEAENPGKAPGEILCADAKQGLVIAAGEGAVRVLELQAPGGKRMNAKDYLRGHPVSYTRVNGI